MTCCVQSRGCCALAQSVSWGPHGYFSWEGRPSVVDNPHGNEDLQLHLRLAMRGAGAEFDLFGRLILMRASSLTYQRSRLSCQGSFAEKMKWTKIECSEAVDHNDVSGRKAGIQINVSGFSNHNDVSGRLASRWTHGRWSNWARRRWP